MPADAARSDDARIDHATLTDLYARYGPVVHRRAMTLLRNEDEAKDALQEVFLRVVERHQTFRGDVPILHWIYRITTNLCLNRIRQKKAHPVVEDAQAVLTLVSDGTQAVMDRTGTKCRLVDRQAVLQLLGKVDPLTQQIAVYYYIDEMSMEEVAEVVGKSRKTVSKKLERFRKRAKATFSDTPEVAS